MLIISSSHKCSRSVIFTSQPWRDDFCMDSPYSILICKMFFEHNVFQNIFGNDFTSVRKTSKSVIHRQNLYETFAFYAFVVLIKCSLKLDRFTLITNHYLFSKKSTSHLCENIFFCYYVCTSCMNNLWGLDGF